VIAEAEAEAERVARANDARDAAAAQAARQAQADAAWPAGPVPSRNIPRGETTGVSFVDVEDGERMVDINDEYARGHYFTAYEAAGLDRVPDTRAAITRRTPYLANLVDPVAGSGRGRGGARPSAKFAKQLKAAGVEPAAYLKEARRRAKQSNYPAQLLGFADDGIHKLAIPDRDGRIIKFGAVGYGDHTLWSALESQGRAAKGTAEAKRSTFHRSHSQIKGDWKSNKYSPNNLALRVLW